MQLHNIKRNKSNRKAKQVGRGGTRGKTSGRGTKGQNARAGRKKRPEMRDFIKKLPKLRGRGRNYLKSIQPELLVVNLGAIESNYKVGDTVSPTTLVEKGVLSLRSGKLPKAKVLGSGILTKAVNIEGLEVSANARAAIEKLGGKIA